MMNRFIFRLAILVLALFSYSVSVEAQDLELKKLKTLSIEELMDVQVTSVSKRKERIAETASAIQVITSEDIRNSGATNVPEALRLATNLQVAQVNASQWAISARGFNNVLANKLLVLINGRVVYTPMYAGVFWDVQNVMLEDVERIEVISGPGGTLWGANAVNGVINIITKNSRDTQGLYAEATVGTEITMGNVRYGGMISDKLSYRVYGMGFKRDNTVFTDSADVDAGDDWQMLQGGVRFDWTPSAKDDVSLSSNFFEGRPDPDGDKPVLASGGNAVARWSHTLSEKSGFQIQAFYDRTWRDFRNGFAEELSTYDIEAQHRFSLGQRHEIIYGGGIRMMDHNVRNLELFAFEPGQKSLYLYNIFVQDEVTLVKEKLRLTLGIKAEHNAYTKYQYQPNARITWLPAKTQTLWAAISRAVRNPARIDREFYLYLAPGLPFIAGGNFQSEEVIAYELGWRTQPNKNLSIALSTFYNEYDNLRTVEPGPPPFGIPVTFGNGVRGNTYGAELSFTQQFTSRWRLRGGYTFLKKDLSVKSTSADQNNGSAESNDPAHQFLIQSTIKPSEKITIGTVLRYVSELPAPQVNEYFGLDLQVTVRVHKMIELNVTGQNLLQDHHTEFIPSSPAAKDIERSFYGKIICRF
jgi:iron complex outermembrane receptor protein